MAGVSQVHKGEKTVRVEAQQFGVGRGEKRRRLIDMTSVSVRHVLVP